MSPRRTRRTSPIQEEKAVLEDTAAQEQPARDEPAGPPPKVGVVAPGYIRATHPDHGEAVVFVPGELLPDWAAEALKAGGAEADPDGIVRL